MFDNSSKTKTSSNGRDRIKAYRETCPNGSLFSIVYIDKYNWSPLGPSFVSRIMFKLALVNCPWNVFGDWNGQTIYDTAEISIPINRPQSTESITHMRYRAAWSWLEDGQLEIYLWFQFLRSNQTGALKRYANLASPPSIWKKLTLLWISKPTNAFERGPVSIEQVLSSNISCDRHRPTIEESNHEFTRHINLRGFVDD